MTKTQKKILDHLTAHKGEVVSREELAKIGGLTYEAGMRNIDIAISSIRKEGHKISTIQRKGYALTDTGEKQLSTVKTVELLKANKDKVLTREKLAEASGIFYQKGKTRSVDSMIHRLRKDSGLLIDSVSKVGYVYRGETEEALKKKTKAVKCVDTKTLANVLGALL